MAGQRFWRYTPASSAQGRQHANRSSQCFQEILNHRGKLSVLKNTGQLDKIDRFLYKDTLAQINQLGVLHNKYQPHFFAGATSALIKAWIEYDFAKSP